MQKYPASPDVSGVQLSKELLDDIEVIAKSVHDEWQRQRTQTGWGFESEQDEDHPAFIPYEELPETEKEVDRATVRQTIRMLHYLGYAVKKNNI